MSDSLLLRLCGACALLGGILRITSPVFGPVMPDEALHLTWLGTDVLLLFGTVGLWAATRTATGAWGLVGTALALIGLVLVRSAGERIFGPDSYGVGAGVWGVGAALLGAALLAGRAGYRTASILWLLALVLGLAGKRLDLWLDGFGWAGLVFAAGQIAAGITLLRRREAAP